MHVPLRRTLLEIVTRGFADRVDIIFPHQRTISQPIAFGLVVPSVTPQIVCLGLVSYNTQSHRESLLRSRLSLLYCALYKPSNVVGLVKTALTLY